MLKRRRTETVNVSHKHCDDVRVMSDEEVWNNSHHALLPLPVLLSNLQQKKKTDQGQHSKAEEE